MKTQSTVYALRSLWGRSALVRTMRYARRYPGLSVDALAQLDTEGTFLYGRNVRVSEGCNFRVPSGATLLIGSDCHIGRYVELGPSGRISIGDNASIQDRSILVGDVDLGRYSILSLNVLMTSGHHYYDRWPHLTIRDQDAMVTGDVRLAAAHSRPISIGEDCWFGMNAVVMRGVSVGRGCVIGSNSVVTRDLEPYSVVAGVPAQLIKKRLEFKPPDRMSWRRLEQIPYFYSGFELTSEERRKNENLGGHLARTRFSIWLAAGNRGSICMRIRSLGSSSICTATGAVSQQVSTEWNEIEIGRSSVSSKTPFILKGDPIVLSDAWVK